MTLPRVRLSGSSRFFFAAVSAFLLCGLFACSDGPDKTGLAYLQSQNIRLSTPLYQFTFKNFPVDSAFATEIPLNHFGESLLVVGRDGPFVAAARMGFQITTQAQRDSITHGLTLRLIALPSSVKGYSFLKSSTAGRDSLHLLIEAYAWNDTSGRFSDSLPVFHRRMLTSFTPFSTLDSKYKVRDTVVISPSAAYPSTGTADSLQVCVLNNLRARMKTDSLHSWLVFLEISPLNKAGSAIQDSGMFRFVGKNSANYDPGLLLGSYVKGSATTTPTLLSSYLSAGLPSVSYQVTHAGSREKLLYGVSRGINLRLNRDSLLSLIRDSLGARDPSLIAKYFSGASGKYDSRFYVPYAVVRLPLADSLSRVDGPFALDMQMVSDVDSLDPQSTVGLIPVPVGGSLALFPTQSGPAGYSGSVSDTLICGYRKFPDDTSLRQLTLHWVKDASITDTFLFVADGKRREVPLKRRTGWFRPATLGLYPNPDNAQVEVYFNIGAGLEPNGFINPTTHTVLSDARSLSGRYWRPGAASLDLRATRGLGALLNRASGVVPELLVRGNDAKPGSHPIYDTAYASIPYPVLGEIGFPRVGGKLRVTVDVYLYPLGNGR